MKGILVLVGVSPCLVKQFKREMLSMEIKLDIRELGVKVEVPVGQADKVQGHAAMLLQEFKWTKYSAEEVQAKLNSRMVVAIVDNGSVGVVIQKAALTKWG